MLSPLILIYSKEKEIFFLYNKSVKDNLITYKCLSCDKYYSNKLMDEELKRN